MVDEHQKRTCTPLVIVQSQSIYMQKSRGELSTSGTLAIVSWPVRFMNLPVLFVCQQSCENYSELSKKSLIVFWGWVALYICVRI